MQKFHSDMNSPPVARWTLKELNGDSVDASKIFVDRINEARFPAGRFIEFTITYGDPVTRINTQCWFELMVTVVELRDRGIVDGMIAATQRPMLRKEPTE